MEKEKGIAREDMAEAIEGAIQSAAQRGPHAGQELKVSINPKNGALQAWFVLKVVDSVSDPLIEIHIEEARKEDSSVAIGDELLREMDPAALGRIAAQTARQTIMQRVRQFERERVYDDYKDLVGDIVSGVVRRRDGPDLIVDLGNAEAALPSRECIPGEEYSIGDRIRGLLLNIDAQGRGPELVISRSHPNFVRRLFELEVTELNDGTISIAGIAREPGYRTKLCVASDDSRVDPVGACVGARGARVKAIVRELGGEKVDVIRYYEDPEQMLAEALKPAQPKNVRIDEEARRIHFEVDESELAVALGSRGRNARLTSRLMGWRLDIAKEEKKDVAFEQRVEQAVEGLHQISGINEQQAALLVQSGITSPAAFEGVTQIDLEEIGFEAADAAHIMKEVRAYFAKQS